MLEDLVQYINLGQQKMNMHEVWSTRNLFGFFFCGVFQQTKSTMEMDLLAAESAEKAIFFFVELTMNGADASIPITTK